MDEHTWGAFDSISDPKTDEAVKQLDVKDKMAVDAGAESDYLARNAMATIASGLKTPRGSAVVFNLLDWPRSGLVEIDIPRGAQIVDLATGRAVAYQVIAARVNVNHVRFLAAAVPGLGYKIYTVRPGHSENTEGAAPATSTLESRFYRVVLDPSTGAVQSIYDKELGRELVDSSSPYRFGQYLYVTGGDKEPNNLLRYSPILPNAELTVHPALQGRLLSVRRTPWGELATLESSAPQTPKIVTEIEVFDNEKKIEFREEVQRTATPAKEAAYFAFPFAADHPRFHYEIQNGVVDPATDFYPGAGHEWYSVQHWVSVEDSAGRTGTVMPLDAPLVTLGDINRGLWPDHFQAKTATVFSYIMNNYWFTNYRAEQGGIFHFRYVVTSAGKYDPVSTSRQGWEEASNLLADQVRSQDVAQGEAPSAEELQRSFLKIDDPAVFLQTWKPAEDGNGTILRLLDLGGSDRTIVLESEFLAGKKAFLTNAVEQGSSPLTINASGRLEVPIHRHEILTIRVTSALGKPVKGGN
jgi:alpha-mannosidase